MKNKISLGDNIRIIREARGYSQDYVASKLEITQQTYSNIEKNPEKATVKRLKEIAGVLQVNFVTLLGEDEMYVQQNFSQNGGNAATQMNVIGDKIENEIYERFIAELKEEIVFLRELTKGKS
jgi:transcriptional regulator with XRE-family HTH domain